MVPILDVFEERFITSVNCFSNSFFWMGNSIYMLNLPGLMILFIFFSWIALQPFEILTLTWDKLSFPTLQNLSSFCTQSFFSRCKLWCVHFKLHLCRHLWCLQKASVKPEKKKQIKSSGAVKDIWVYLTSDLIQGCIMLKISQHRFHL